MDLTQKTAIETLVGRVMTAGEITLAENRQDKELADALSAGRTRLVPACHTELEVLDILGPILGGALLDGLDAFVAAGQTAAPLPIQPYFSAIKRAVAALYTGAGLDLGATNTRLVLNALASSGVVAPASVDVLLAAAVTPHPVPVDMISNILNG